MKKYIFLSDIHSNIGALNELKNIEEYNDKESTLVFLGDYIDGFYQEENSGLDVIRFVKNEIENNNAVALLGNHDQFLVNMVLGERNVSAEYYRIWKNNGMEKTLNSWGIDPSIGWENIIYELKNDPYIELIKFLSTLKPSMELSEKIRIAHAGIRWNIEFDKQNVDDLLWIRQEYYFSTNQKLKSNLGYVYVTGHTPNQYINGESNIIRIDKEEDTTLYLIDAGSKGVNKDETTKINVLILNEDGEYIKSYQLEG